MKIGIVTFPRIPEEYVKFAKDNGFEHLEVDTFSENQFLETFDPKRIGNLKKAAGLNSITLSVHTPYTLNPAERLPTIRAAHLSFYGKLIELTAKLKGEWLTAHIGYHIGFPAGKKKAVERSLNSLKELLGIAEGLGVVLAIENVNPMPSGSEMFYVGGNIEEINYIFSNLDSDFLRLCLDVGHANTAEGAQRYIDLFGDKIVNVHVHDNRGVEDEHLPLGEGNIDWKSVVKALRNINYAGPLNLEIGRDEEKVKCKEFLSKLLKS